MSRLKSQRSPRAAWLGAVLVLAAVETAIVAPAQAAEEPAAQVDFSRHVRPILSGKCFRCHGPDEDQRQADLRLDGARLAKVGVIVAGRPSESDLIQRLTSDDPDERMPPPDSKLTLTANEIALLTRWVAEGADYALHWAFVQPERPAVPPVEPRSWQRNEIDAFVLKRLEEAKLEPSPEADKLTLIRRLSLDLTGLPPTLERVDRFLSDDSLQAYQRLVDRLLASQHFGEQMAREWLDLARYGDTNGYENDSERQMWLYRDWVINAFNANLPFDRFTIEQIAGDLLPDADTSQRIASGFNRNTTYNEEGGADPEEFQVAYAVERASTTATVFLGLTLGCAECHDHKYDPISQKEFYKFYAFFNSVDGEKGAMGHDLPLPPLISLPTKEQAADLKRAREELAELDAHIKEQVERVKVEPPAALANSAGTATRPATQPAGDPEEGIEKKAEKKRYFDDRTAWEDHERQQEKSKLPKTIRELVKLERDERSDEQERKLEDYFIQHTYSRTRHIFEPLVTKRVALEKRAKAIDKSIITTMVMKEMAERRPAYLLIRGSFEQKGDEVKPDVPAIFPRFPPHRPRTRLGLAYWLADVNNPLIARVAVNRFWRQLFGTGLVKTMNDFGVRGEFPSHPELLDWLATEFVRTGWNVKAVLKEIVLSATYRQASRYRQDAARIDPFNRLLARQNRFRLAAEEIRDVALAVSGLLSYTVGGPSVFPYQPPDYYSDKGRWKWPQSTGRDLYRRGLYTFWRRTTFYPSFQIFDAPSREVCTVDRPRTNTPLQALVTLNGVTFVEAARVFAERILFEGGPSPEDKLRFAFRTTLARRPDEHERDVLGNIFADQLARYTADPEAAAALVQQGERQVPEDVDIVRLAAWSTVANVLLNLDEAINRE